ncbi:MAG TPA: YdcF family protein [Clostridia bacterium]|nr:YdcF family protein [Clostridia bacterium]
MRGISEAKVISRVKRKTSRKRYILPIVMILLLQFLAIECLIIFSGYSDTPVKTDYLIILGAGLKGDIPNVSLRERLAAGVQYLEKNPYTIVVVSGGQGRGETITEAEAMKKYLVSKGIDEGRILSEPRASSTMENFKFSRELIEANAGKQVREVAFITNSFHILRAKMLAERNGFNAHAISGKTVQIVIPSYIREYFALIKSFVFDR